MRGHVLRRRYGRSRRLQPGVSVTKVRFKGPDGGFRGVGTRVVLEDGWTTTFMGAVPKGEALRQAQKHRERGERSE